MRRAQQAAFGKQSAAVQTSLAPHDSKARLRVDTTCRRFMAKPCTPHPITRKGYATSVRQQSCQRLCNPQAAQLFKCQSANAKPFSWGSKGAILFCEREWPLCPVPLRNAGETRSPRSGNAVFTSCAPPISGIVPRSFFGYFRSRGFLPPACRGRSSSCRV